MANKEYAWSSLPQNSLDEGMMTRSFGQPGAKFPTWVTLNRNLRILVFFAVVLIFWGIFRAVNVLRTESDYFNEIRLGNVGFTDEEGHSDPSDLAVPKLSSTWYEEMCFSGGRQLGTSISDIYEKLELMKGSSNAECQTIWTLFDRMFRLELIHAPIVLPKDFQEEVKGWLGNDPALFDQVNHQKVYKVVNKDSYEETVFNPLRSRRPSSKTTANPLDYIAELSNSTRASCDFCKYKYHTAADSFGRIENVYSASASNTFKLAKFHGLFFPRTHHPLDLPHEVIADLFVNTSQQWFSKAHETDALQRYPSLLWDVLPHAGASQVHPHIHGILDSHQYAGSFEKLHDIAQRYFEKFRRSYWTDLFLIHWALGLGVSFENTALIVPLFARKDHEYVIISKSVDENFAYLISRVLEAYRQNLKVYCFSSGGAYPMIGSPVNNLDRYEQPGLPVIFRFGSRGVCTSVSSDVSSLELYSVNNINSDLSKTIQAFKKTVTSPPVLKRSARSL